VGVLGYGSSVGPAFGGALSGKELASISEIANSPVRVEERAKKVDDGAGGLVDQKVRFPIWFDATTAEALLCVRHSAKESASSSSGSHNMQAVFRQL